MPHLRLETRRLPLLICALASILSITVASEQAHAGAWAQPDKGAYFKISAAASMANTQYKDSGEVFPLLSDDIPGSFAAQGLFWYGEYGLLPRLTVFGTGAFQRLELDSNLQTARTTGFSDLTLGARYQFLDEPAVVSVSFASKIPTGYSPDLEPMTPTLGNGVGEYDIRLLVGKSFYPAPVYVSGEVGYRIRGSRSTAIGDTVDFADEIPYFLEVGYQPIDGLLVRGVVNGLKGLGRPEDLDIFSLTPTTQSYTKVGPSLIYSLNENYQLSLDYLYTVRGVNTVKGHDLIFGFAITFGQ